MVLLLPPHSQEPGGKARACDGRNPGHHPYSAVRNSSESAVAEGPLGRDGQDPDDDHTTNRT